MKSELVKKEAAIVDVPKSGLSHIRTKIQTNNLALMTHGTGILGSLVCGILPAIVTGHDWFYFLAVIAYPLFGIPVEIKTPRMKINKAIFESADTLGIHLSPRQKRYLNKNYFKEFGDEKSGFQILVEEKGKTINVDVSIFPHIELNNVFYSAVTMKGNIIPRNVSLEKLIERKNSVVENQVSDQMDIFNKSIEEVLGSDFYIGNKGSDLSVNGSNGKGFSADHLKAVKNLYRQDFLNRLEAL